jgi:hypothetical protein
MNPPALAVSEYVCPECGACYWVRPNQNCGDCYFGRGEFVRLKKRDAGDHRRSQTPLGNVAAARNREK